MQIHELPSLTRDVLATDTIAIDSGQTTYKVSLTEPIEDVVQSIKVLVVEIASISTLPQSVSNEDITSDMVVLNSVLGTPSAQTSDWTVTTSTGSLEVDGSISGTTSLTLYLAQSR